MPPAGVRDDVLGERLAVDGITVASKGPQGVSAALLGSVARYLLSSSHRPILIVRAH